MTVVNDLDDTTLERLGPFYVRLQNLPMGACQKHIREFFHGLSVPSGGVSIHRGCAFVVFDSQDDAQLAVSLDQRFLDGKAVRVSNADSADVRRTQMFDVRRKLVVSVPESCTMMKYMKRIRPTLVKDGAGEIESSAKFCPDEVEFPGKVDESCLLDEKLPQKVKDCHLPDLKFPGKVSFSIFQDKKTKVAVKRIATKKTIKPTPVITLNQFNLVYEGTVF